MMSLPATSQQNNRESIQPRKERHSRNMPGKLILTSINPDFAPIEADTSEQLGGLVRIIGRAVWVGRELD